MNPFVEVLLRSILSFAFILILAEFLGAKQISQLTFSDYILGITLGSMASTLAIDDSLPVWYGITGMAVFALFTFIVNLLNRKTIWGRRLLEGKPHVLIEDGKISYKELKRAQFSVNDLLRELRTQGYFNIADVNHAIQETNGMLSVLPKSAKRQVVTEDLNLTLPEQGLCANLIIDGNIMTANLRAMGRDVNWLLNELEKQQVKPEDVLLATLDTDYKLSAYIKDGTEKKRSILQ